jgi:hypothetical protein
MMEFVVGTDEYMFVEPIETTGMLGNQTWQSIVATATYAIYKDDEPLTTGNAVVQPTPVNGVVDNKFKCRIAPDSTWDQGRYALYLKITDIPGFAEKPRFGPFVFDVIQ